MFIKLVFVFILASSGLCRHVPRYTDLDEDDQMLFKAAYDTPSYEHEEYQEDEELPNKLDLLKGGMWAIKAKIKEMKIFNKALAANLLATKLQVKELLANHLKTLKKHPHIEIEKTKPVYSYQVAPAPPAYPHYEPQHYTAPVAPAAHYGQPQYGPSQYEPPKYEAHQYGSPQYGAPLNGHDPYYGH